jgi:PKD repeat protein
MAADTLTILGGAVLAVLLVNLSGFGAPMVDAGSPTPPDTGLVVARSEAPIPTLPPLDTLGPIVNSSVGIEATPTPIPIITLGPSPSVDASASLGPSPKPTPRPTPPPPPVAFFTCPTVHDLVIFCDGSASTHAQPGSYAWTFGDTTTGTGITIQHTYAAYDTYTVTLTVTGLDGATTSTALRVVSVVAPSATP